MSDCKIEDVAVIIKDIYHHVRDYRTFVDKCIQLKQDADNELVVIGQEQIDKMHDECEKSRKQIKKLVKSLPKFEEGDNGDDD